MCIRDSRETDRQTHRETERERDTHTHTHTHTDRQRIFDGTQSKKTQLRTGPAEVAFSSQTTDFKALHTSVNLLEFTYRSCTINEQ